MDGRTSGRTDAVLTLDRAGSLELRRADDRALLHAGRFDEVRVSPRVGSTPRSLRFAGGEQFETRDNDSVDEALSRLRPSPWRDLVHRLESHWQLVALTVVLVAASAWGTVVYGVPFAAKVIAEALPPAVADVASEQTLEILEDRLFQPSRLDEQRRQEVRRYLQGAVDDHGEHSLKVLFRYSEALGANAFALPDGTIVFTDAMVRTAENNDELLAVFAHEVGHVVHRHGLRRMVQSSLLGFMLITITGDVSAASEAVLILPVVLTEMAYSRDAEREADDYALTYLRRIGVSPQHFVALMQRLEKRRALSDEGEGECRAPDESPGGAQWMEYLSTHPATEERLEKFRSP